MSIESDWPASARQLALRERRAEWSLVAGFVVSVTLVSMVMSLVYTRARSTSDARTRLEHARDVAASLDAAVGDLADIELAQSRYMLTGASRYVGVRNAGATALDHHLRDIRELVAEDADQSVRLSALTPPLADLVSRIREGALVSEAEPLDNDVAARLAEMQRDAARSLAQENADFGRAISAEPSVFLKQLAMVSGILCLFYALFHNRISRRREARNAILEGRRRAETECTFTSTAVARARCDIRSSLTAILGYCDLPIDAGAAARDRIASIRRQTDLIGTAINGLLGDPGNSGATTPSRSPQMEAIPTNTEPAPPPPATERPEPACSGRVLLAEDNLELQQVIKFYLQNSGADVSLVPDGHAACEQALLAWKKDVPFDLVLMDVQMPKTDGRAATIFLRDAGYTDPIVAISANATDQERRRCLAAGCNGFLSKPIDRGEFQRTMRRYLHSDVPVLVAASHEEPESNATIDPQLAALRESFQTEIPTRIAEIGAAVVAGNLARVADLSHQLKGTSGCFGLADICAAANALQTASELPESAKTIQNCFKTLSELTAVPSSPAQAA